VRWRVEKSKKISYIERRLLRWCSPLTACNRGYLGVTLGVTAQPCKKVTPNGPLGHCSPRR